MPRVRPRTVKRSRVKRAKKATLFEDFSYQATETRKRKRSGDPTHITPGDFQRRRAKNRKAVIKT